MKTFKEYKHELDLEWEKLHPSPILPDPIPPGYIYMTPPGRLTLEISNEILVMTMNDFIEDLRDMKEEIQLTLQSIDSNTSPYK